MYQYCNMINMQPCVSSGMLGEPACQRIFCDAWLLTGYKGDKKSKSTDNKLVMMAQARYLRLVEIGHLNSAWQYRYRYYCYGDGTQVSDS